MMVASLEEDDVANDMRARGGVEENLEELRPEEIDANNMRQDGANDRRARGGDEENLEELRQEGEDDEESCKEEKHEEIMKFRMHQYRENPNMMITGEDIELAMSCDHCGPCITDQVRQDCGECGQGWVR